MKLTEQTDKKYQLKIFKNTKKSKTTDKNEVFKCHLQECHKKKWNYKSTDKNTHGTSLAISERKTGMINLANKFS